MAERLLTIWLMLAIALMFGCGNSHQVNRMALFEFHSLLFATDGTKLWHVLHSDNFNSSVVQVRQLQLNISRLLLPKAQFIFVFKDIKCTWLVSIDTQMNYKIVPLQIWHKNTEKVSIVIFKRNKSKRCANSILSHATGNMKKEPILRKFFKKEAELLSVFCTNGNTRVIFVGKSFYAEGFMKHRNHTRVPKAKMAQIVKSSLTVNLDNVMSLYENKYAIIRNGDSVTERIQICTLDSVKPIQIANTCDFIRLELDDSIKIRSSLNDLDFEIETTQIFEDATESELALKTHGNVIIIETVMPSEHNTVSLI